MSTKQNTEVNYNNKSHTKYRKQQIKNNGNKS